MSEIKIGVIGCGNMGGGIAQRLAQAYPLALYDLDETKVANLAKSLQAQLCRNIAEVVSFADIIFLAVKTHDLVFIADQIKPFSNPNKLLISVLASTTTHKLKEILGDFPFVRMMPNLAAIYGKGVIGLSEYPILPPERVKEVEEICSHLGLIHWLSEDKIEALTALTGSGPAIVFVMIEAMIEVAIGLGFTAKQGQELILQMLEGSITLLRETGKHPAELKWLVASPGGTTIAALSTMEEEGVRAGISKAFLAAYKKATNKG